PAFRCRRPALLAAPAVRYGGCTRLCRLRCPRRACAPARCSQSAKMKTANNSRCSHRPLQRRWLLVSAAAAALLRSRAAGCPRSHAASLLLRESAVGPWPSHCPATASSAARTACAAAVDHAAVRRCNLRRHSAAATLPLLVASHGIVSSANDAAVRCRALLRNSMRYA
ncbi:hypothetical protein Dimus_007937, partial [Dionaea muscipula]